MTSQNTVTPDPTADWGTPGHAAHVANGRHPGVQAALQWLAFSHLPEPLQRFSGPFYFAAVKLIQEIGTDGPELTSALNGLISAKDHAMRAGIRHDTGRAGSVPRPQTVVDPPAFASGTASVPGAVQLEVQGGHLRPIKDNPQA